MKVAFFEVGEDERRFFESALEGRNVEAFFYAETIDAVVDAPADFDAVSVFVHSRVDRRVLERLPKLRYVQTRSTGYDHIDCRACYERGVTLSNVRGYAGPAVGEFAFGLLLEATRRLHVAIGRLENGDRNYLDLKGREIAGKTVGILGLGTIGMQMARIARGFGAEVAGYSRTEKPEYAQAGIRFTRRLEEILPASDFLMIALPLTPSTRNLIHAGNIGLFRGGIIVNPARAEILSDEVYERFDGIIAADVLPRWELAKREHIIATPHMAYYTAEALRRIWQISLENLTDVLAGNPPRDCLKIACHREY